LRDFSECALTLLSPAGILSQAMGAQPRQSTS
jgi:hypothetical protein